MFPSHHGIADNDLPRLLMSDQAFEASVVQVRETISTAMDALPGQTRAHSHRNLYLDL